jgi:hypothetical protein
MHLRPTMANIYPSEQRTIASRHPLDPTIARTNYSLVCGSNVKTGKYLSHNVNTKSGNFRWLEAAENKKKIIKNMATRLTVLEYFER